MRLPPGLITFWTINDAVQVLQKRDKIQTFWFSPGASDPKFVASNYISFLPISPRPRQSNVRDKRCGMSEIFRKETHRLILEMERKQGCERRRRPTSHQLISPPTWFAQLWDVQSKYTRAIPQGRLQRNAAFVHFLLVRSL